MRCPLPDLPLRDMLKDFNITKLRFYSINDENKTSLHSNFLQGLHLLRNLRIEQTEIESIPSDIFSSSPKLVDISLTNNNLKHLPEAVFQQTQNLAALDLGGNNLTTLPNKIFFNLTKLRRMYLYNNNLTSLPADCFAGLKNVTILELRNNALTKLPPGIFGDMIGLKQLGLSGNNFITLSSELFRNNTNITVLNLSKIRFKYLPEDLLKGLMKLEQFKVPDCNMTSFPNDFFYHAKNLKHVTLYNNRLKTISPLLFSRNKKLETLKMEMNDLTNLTYGMFKGLFNLKYLLLTGNNIRNVAPDTFKDLIALEKLLLNRNEIVSLDNDVFSTILNIEYIDLSHNRIIASLFTHFIHLSKLQNLNLSFNNLTSVPSVENLVQLKKVDLRKNQIHTLKPTTDASASIRYLLQYNNISTIDLSIIKILVWVSKDNKLRTDLRMNQGEQAFPNPSTYYVSNNPMNCDCTISDLIIYLKKMAVLFIGSVPIRFDTNNLLCAEPRLMKGQKVIELEPNEPTCLIVEKCPKDCTCSYRNVNRTTKVQCENMILRSLPSELPHNTSVLHFKNVSMTDKHLSMLREEMYDNVTHLHFGHNMISMFPEEYLPAKLKLLDLRFNSLEAMPKWLPKYSKRHAVDYYFGNNSWVCNCSALSFKSWLTQNHKHVRDIKNIVCSTKGKFKGPLLQIPDTELCPQSSYAPKELLISSITSIIVISVLIIIIAILYYKQKQNIVIFLFTHNMCQLFFKEEDVDEDKLFDAFISYSYHNRDFVIDHLIPELEQKEPRYNLCIHERNFMPGKSIVENIINAIELSRRTVIILSNEFVESDWGMLEFSVAHHQMLKDCINRVVIVMMDEISEKSISVKELQFFLSTKTYLKKEELWFWDKLRYALPRRPLQQKNKDGPLLVLPNLDQQRKLKPKIEEVNIEINDKIAKKLSTVDNNVSDHPNNSSEQKLNGLINPIFTDDMKFSKQAVIQMEPRGKNPQLCMTAPTVKENLI